MGPPLRPDKGTPEYLMNLLARYDSVASFCSANLLVCVHACLCNCIPYLGMQFKIPLASCSRDAVSRAPRIICLR